MRHLIFLVGVYFLVKAGLDAFHFVQHFSSYSFHTAYAAGFTTGQALAPLVFVVVGVVFIVYSVRRWSSISATVKTV